MNLICLSQLLIDGHLVVDNDGAHGPQERSGNAGLMKGKHEIVIRYFEAWGGDSLAVSWQGPEIKKELIPASILSHKSLKIAPPVATGENKKAGDKPVKNTN